MCIARGLWFVDDILDGFWLSFGLWIADVIFGFRMACGFWMRGPEVPPVDRFQVGRWRAEWDFC